MPSENAQQRQNAAIVLATSIGFYANSASAHTVMQQVGRPQQVCEEVTRPFQVIVGYSGAGRFRQPIWGWRTETRTVRTRVNVLTWQPRRHAHISVEDCQFYGVTAAALGGAVAAAPIGAAVGAAVAYEYCQYVNRIIWY